MSAVFEETARQGSEIFGDLIVSMTVLCYRKHISRSADEERETVINILQNLEAMSIDRNEDKKRAQKALAEILSMEKRLPDEFVKLL